VYAIAGEKNFLDFNLNMRGGKLVVKQTSNEREEFVSG
jgi:hypothetical protein